MKNKKGQVNFMVAIMITLIISVIALGIVAGTLKDQSTQTAITGDAFSSVNGTCIAITDICYLAGTLTTQNATSGVTTTGNFTECDSTNNGKKDGALLKITGADAKLDGVTLNASYVEIGCNYITNGTTRTIVNYTPMLLGIVLLAFLGGMISKKD